MSNLIFPPLAPDLQVCVIGKNSAEISKTLGISTAGLEVADAAIFIVNAIDGIDQEGQTLWETARELYIPSLILITGIEESEIDFDDMSAIAGRLLDPVTTPYLVLHGEDGLPIALIDLDSLKLIDYSNGQRVERDSDPEHKLLVFEFRKEYLAALEEFGSDSFSTALTFPAIPFISSLGIGKFEILNYLTLLPSRN